MLDVRDESDAVDLDVGDYMDEFMDDAGPIRSTTRSMARSTVVTADPQTTVHYNRIDIDAFDAD